jgi:hypothetical protein
MDTARRKCVRWPDPREGALAGSQLEIDVLIYLRATGLELRDSAGRKANRDLDGWSKTTLMFVD